VTEEATKLGMNLAEMKEVYEHTEKLLQESKNSMVTAIFPAKT
jgi:hypothetical protein